MHDLRDSGNIEQDSDVVIILHRNKDDDGKMDNSMKMNVLKNRVTGQINYCIAEIVGEVFTLK
jgi:replicative DNA helicase